MEYNELVTHLTGLKAAFDAGRMEAHASETQSVINILGEAAQAADAGNPLTKIHKRVAATDRLISLHRELERQAIYSEDKAAYRDFAARTGQIREMNSDLIM